ncbi:hypothetical protein G3N59_05550 [Paraburkholderia sp. Ac-20340]|uniref:hypothetical protein n=1 Tax=Paraburkholderia sp. Ac-20340 TaxID=2703888 RepID=UPI00197CB597|nr:hypothetical protein [Paraburkholderia sp. Ac-20340]MBN3852840.1 hypothetical protein [Paraburkholderia sp. Ac-20340]
MDKILAGLVDRPDVLRELRNISLEKILDIDTAGNLDEVMRNALASNDLLQMHEAVFVYALTLGLKFVRQSAEYERKKFCNALRFDGRDAYKKILRTIIASGMPL